MNFEHLILRGVKGPLKTYFLSFSFLDMVVLFLKTSTYVHPLSASDGRCLEFIWNWWIFIEAHSTFHPNSNSWITTWNLSTKMPLKFNEPFKGFSFSKVRLAFLMANQNTEIAKKVAFDFERCNWITEKGGNVHSSKEVIIHSHIEELQS